MFVNAERRSCRKVLLQRGEVAIWWISHGAATIRDDAVGGGMPSEVCRMDASPEALGGVVIATEATMHKVGIAWRQGTCILHS